MTHWETARLHSWNRGLIISHIPALGYVSHSSIIASQIVLGVWPFWLWLWSTASTVCLTMQLLGACCTLSPSVETISLDISALYEGGSRKKGPHGNQIGNICKGLKDIDALITALKLVLLALETITPCSRVHCSQFQWRIDDFVVHNAEWVNLS
ncbi:hypothetical protein BS17DRAFT_769538 [Gyrodon lividus]|nr:hypothetical protein BS17DRAFT_769538 [Gyrodon lividus]